MTTVTWGPPGHLVTSGGHRVMVCVWVVQTVDVVQLVTLVVAVDVGLVTMDVVLP